MNYKTIKNTVMKFLPNTDHEQVVGALLAGQKIVKIDGTEIHLETLTRDTRKRKEEQANIMAEEIIQALRS